MLVGIGGDCGTWKVGVESTSGLPWDALVFLYVCMGVLNNTLFETIVYMTYVGANKQENINSSECV